jgi:hypothetical protein
VQPFLDLVDRLVSEQAAALQAAQHRHQVTKVRHVALVGDVVVDLALDGREMLPALHVVPSPKAALAQFARPFVGSISDKCLSTGQRRNPANNGMDRTAMFEEKSDAFDQKAAEGSGSTEANQP